nr:hypothetical protein [Tanacetum cinerariifolium]
MNVNFDELLAMASKQFSLEPDLSKLNETGKFSYPSVSKGSEASKKDLEDLFQDFYDEYFDSSKIMKSSTTNVETPIIEEVFHEGSESFQRESSSSSLNAYATNSRRSLWYPKDSGFDLTAYSDANHAGCHLDRKTKSEYVAVSSCCAQVLWMRTQLTDYGFFYDKVPIYCDSKSAIAISSNPVQHTCTKHIDVSVTSHKSYAVINYYGKDYSADKELRRNLPKELRRIMEIETDIETMTLNKYWEYEAKKERQLWDNIRSKRRPTNYDEADFDSFHQNKSSTFNYPYSHNLPPPHPCSLPVQPYPKNYFVYTQASNDVDIKCMTIAEDKILNVTMVYEGAECSPTKDLEELERLLAKDPQLHYQRFRGSNNKETKF